MSSDLAREMRTPERLVVGHPFNPPEVLPLVEVVPGERTAPWAVETAVDFYRSVGKKPVVLHREIGGVAATPRPAAAVRGRVWPGSHGGVCALGLRVRMGGGR